MISGLVISGIWTIMVAVAHNIPTIMVGRLLTGVFGAAPISIIGGATTDNWNAIDRGVALAFVIGMVFSGPFFGPIIGDFMSQNVSWRWTMWLCVIASFVIGALALFTLPETYAPVVLAHKAKRLRKETGNPNLKCKWDLESPNLGQIVNVYLIRPWRKYHSWPSY
jgi:MFS transporter, DHA1 family, multidrug resistance protein